MFTLLKIVYITLHSWKRPTHILYNFTHCDDLFLVICLFCSFVCLSLLLLLCAFYVRVDTVISRNGMNKVFCTYSLERQSQCHLMHPFSATALTSKFSVFFPVCLFSVIVSFTLHRRQELVAHNLKWDNETWIKLEALPAGTNPRTPHHWSLGGERRGKRKRSTIFLERTREGQRQSDERWNRFKGNVGETSER